MADNTKIEWTDATWNPVNGCSLASPGCTNCYAMKQAHRVPARQGLTIASKGGMVWTGAVRFNEKELLKPLRWKRPRMIFVCAHGDLFHESVPDDWIDRVFAVMALCPQHTFQVLTKRSARLRGYFRANPTARICNRTHSHDVARRGDRLLGDGREALLPLPNVWLGVSVEDQQRADERIPDLLATPAAIRWISAEPLLGPVRLTHLSVGYSGELDGLRGTWRSWPITAGGPTGRILHMMGDLPKLDWVVVGGESGKGARPMHPCWARSLRDQCAAADVPFFFKQWGEWVALGAGDGWWPTTSETCIRLMADGDRGENGHAMQRVGKKHAGRLLDGDEHNAMPRV